MAANHYGCLSTKHTEFTCAMYSYTSKRFTRERWCEPCQARFPERDA